ncbi:TonB-dependent receptor [Leadbetterella sp. DM7]|uniref:TonB-dependent receptor n=1 Tax=Leadbetterella sp. DM7 TaxID=3235085 RepID=UPI00349EC358
MKPAYCFIFRVLSSLSLSGQVKSVIVSGTVRAHADKSVVPYANIVLKTAKDSVFVAGTVTNDEGRFTLANISPGNYSLQASFTGYETRSQHLFVGSLSAFLDIPALEMEESTTALAAMVITGSAEEVSYKVDIRIFPKYDDAEIIKVGNPALRPQFTNSAELGHRYSWNSGYLYSAVYHRQADGTITRISAVVPGRRLVYAVFQNAGKSYNTGLDALWNQKVSGLYAYTLSTNIYRNQINAFTVQNLYPEPNIFPADRERNENQGHAHTGSLRPKDRPTCCRAGLSHLR